MGKLHDKLKAIGYEGHNLEVYLVRLLFCLFAEDTSIFERRLFQDLIEQRTAEDGSDLAMRLEQLFQVLDAPQEKRLKNLDEQLAAFPYVNGSLFKERLPMASFDTEMRENLLLCCALDWSRISPAIFGALFQSVMDQKLRRNLGAHYTTEKNILKLIRPLFLDELRAEFERVKSQPKKLYDFHQRLAQLKFLDPACGCGNFLVIAYRELRLLELDVIRSLYGKAQSTSIDVAELNILCDVDQFYGIEIEEFPAQIAQTACGLGDLGWEFFYLDAVKLVYVAQDVQFRYVYGCGLRFSVQAANDIKLQQAQFAIGDDQEIAAATSRIEEFELGKALMKIVKLLGLAFHPLEFCPQFVQEQGADELKDILFRRVMCAEVTAQLLIHNRLEQGTENRRAYPAPIQGAAQQQVLPHFGIERCHRQAFFKQATVDVRESSELLVEIFKAFFLRCIKHLK